MLQLSPLFFDCQLCLFRISAVPENGDESKNKINKEKSGHSKQPPFVQSKIIFTDNNVSFLARQILAKEEWKRLAYALGFYPDDVSFLRATIQPLL